MAEIMEEDGVAAGLTANPFSRLTFQEKPKILSKRRPPPSLSELVQASTSTS